MIRRPSADDATTRFSGRVADYARYRPSYPKRLVSDLEAEGRLKAGQVVADIGSGTGLLSRLFLDAGCRVLAVEPNREMRLAGDGRLGGRAGFTSLDGTAEGTGIPNRSVDWVVAGQAFHWFDPERARQEFCRILVPGGTVMLAWNERRCGASPFLRGYEALLQEFGTDYRKVDHRRLDDAVFRRFFAHDRFEIRNYPNAQHLDREALTGRLLSSSYTPVAGDPARAAMLERLDRLFSETSESGVVEMLYDTRAWIGEPARQLQRTGGTGRSRL